MEKFSADVCDERKERNEKDHEALWTRLSTLDKRMWIALATAFGSAVGSICTLATVIVMLITGAL